MNVEIVQKWGNDLTVVNSARVSYASESNSLTDRDKKLIKYLADHDHMSPFEHCGATFIISCPLYIRSQIMRHRTFSYNEISRRYTDKDIEIYQPYGKDFRKQDNKNKQSSVDELTDNDQIKASMIVQKTHSEALNAYNRLIEMGVAREIARGVLPQNTMTKFYMSGNLRNYIHFLKLRLPKDAQKEVQEIAKSMYKLLKNEFSYIMDVLMEKQVWPQELNIIKLIKMAF